MTIVWRKQEAHDYNLSSMECVCVCAVHANLSLAFRNIINDFVFDLYA